MRSIHFIPLFVAMVLGMFGCNHETSPKFLKCSGNTKGFEFPQNMDVTYKGYTVATIMLIDSSNGLYKLTKIDEKAFFIADSRFEIKPKDILGIDFLMTVDTLTLEPTRSADTLYYTIDKFNAAWVPEELDKLLPMVEELLDTLATLDTTGKIDSLQQLLLKTPH